MGIPDRPVMGMYIAHAYFPQPPQKLQIHARYGRLHLILLDYPCAMGGDHPLLVGGDYPGGDRAVLGADTWTVDLVRRRIQRELLGVV